MADPLSITVSIAGIISLADVAFRSVFKYVRKAKNAEKDVENLKEKIDGLCSALRILSALADDLETEDGPCKTAVNLQLLEQCGRTLFEISEKVQKAVQDFTQATKLKRLGRQLKWPFSSLETKGLMDDLSWCKSTISLATSADSLSKLQNLLSRQVEYQKRIEFFTQKIYSKSEITANILLDKERAHMLNYFMKPALNPQSSLDQSVKSRHPTTGSWLLASPEVENWFTSPGSRLWLNGIPGGGKTVLAGAVIQEALSRSSASIGVAFFFCDYKNPETLLPVNILGAIASQLALQRDDAFKCLMYYYETYHPSRGLAQEPKVHGLQGLIKDMIAIFYQVLIVVDGLDECGDSMGNVVTSLIGLTAPGNRATIALFSRDEIEIRSQVQQDFTEISIEAHTQDIEEYVRAELKIRIQSRRVVLRMPETRKRIEQELINRAQGMYDFPQSNILVQC